MNTSHDIAQLQARFSIPGVADIVAGHGGLPKIHINTVPATADIYLYGAQVTSFVPAGQADLLFLSEESRWEQGRAIRGGIPICFPWFRAKADNPQAPAHGVVRTRLWELTSLSQTDEGVVATLATQSDEASHQWFPHNFHVVHRIVVGSALRLMLIARNTGTTTFSLEEALHSYHLVSDAEKIHVSGLNGTRFLDNMDGNREKVQPGEVTLTRQTDNAYLDTEATLDLVDPGLHRRIRIEKHNSRTSVVWNPWSDGAARLADLGNDEWRRFACVEASNILQSAITLKPGEEHAIAATISVQPD